MPRRSLPRPATARSRDCPCGRAAPGNRANECTSRRPRRRTELRSYLHCSPRRQISHRLACGYDGCHAQDRLTRVQRGTVHRRVGHADRWGNGGNIGRSGVCILFVGMMAPSGRLASMRLPALISRGTILASRRRDTTAGSRRWPPRGAGLATRARTESSETFCRRRGFGVGIPDARGLHRSAGSVSPPPPLRPRGQRRTGLVGARDATFEERGSATGHFERAAQKRERASVTRDVSAR
jgi:hypothetical protein